MLRPISHNTGTGAGRAVILGADISRSKTIHFLSSSPGSLEDVLNGTARSTTSRGELFMPAGASVKSPGMVIVHGLGGQTYKRELTYAAKLARSGYAVLVLDCFGARGYGRFPEIVVALAVSSWTLAADMFAGLKCLAAHPQVDPSAIAVAGFSWGGMVSVLAAYEQIRKAFLRESDLRFAGQISYYGCSVPRLQHIRATGAPVLMMAGEKDRNVSISRTEEICADLQRGGARVSLLVFDAYHQWNGIDQRKRHFPFSIAGLELRVAEDGQVIEEQSGRSVRGSRTLLTALMRRLGFKGYDMLRDPRIHRTTDEILLRFLSENVCPSVPPDPCVGIECGSIGRQAAK